METRDLDRIRFVTRHFNDLQGLRYWVPLGLVMLSWGVFASPFAARPPVAALCLMAVLLMLGARRRYRTVFGEVESQPVLSTADLYPVSLSQVATVTRIQVPPLRSPVALHFLAVMGTAVLLFAIGQVFTPIVRILDTSPVTLDAVELFVRPARLWKYPKPIEFGALFAQVVCLLHGSFFLAMWLWRGRRSSQKRYLALGVALLGIAALGTQLGRLVAVGTEPLVRLIDFLLPAVVHPWIALFVCGSSMILTGLLDHWQLVRSLGSAAPGEEESS
jgi:hypothetical protein